MADDQHPDNVSRARNVGMVLFLIYVLLYGGFMYFAAFRPDIMNDNRAPGGVNIAIAYGMGLILAAFLLAVIYMFLAKPPAK